MMEQQRQQKPGQSPQQPPQGFRPPVGPGGPGRGPGPGGPMGMMPGEKAKNLKGTLQKLMGYLKPFHSSIIVVIIFAVLSTAFSIVGPKILGGATTEVYTGVMKNLAGTGGIDFSKIADILLLLFVLYLFSLAIGFLQSFIMTGVTQKVTYQLRRDIAAKINVLPLSFFDKTTHGEVLSRMTNDVDTVSQSLSQSMTQIITSVATLAGVLVMMFSISPLLTVIILLTLPISVLIIKTVMGKSQPYFKKQQRFLGEVNGHIEEMYSGHVVIRAFNQEEKSVDTFQKINNKLYDTAWKSQFFSSLMMPLMKFVGNLSYVIVCMIGAMLSVNGQITLGNIQAFLQYTRNFTQPIQQIANISNVLQSTAAAAERVFEFLEEVEESADPQQTIDTESLKGNVSFEHVKFGYRPEKIIIKGFSSEIKAGESVAIVGPTGAGKTTIVKLLMRYYDVNEGSILIDGHDIRKFPRNDLRNMMGMVLQDTWLYNGTIMENIRYGRLNATDEEVIKAAKAAQVHHFVKTLPAGYSLELNEEASNISQGQKQLLTIARTILSDPKILILDEATSSVDTRTEILIQKAMNHLMEGRTSFIIAHRLSTIRDADKIMVMKEGDIVEIGSHEELMAKGGFYRELYTSQFENQAVS